MYQILIFLRFADRLFETPAMKHDHIQSGNFINCFKLLHSSVRSIEKEWKEAIPRLNKYYLTNFPFSGSFRIEKLMNKFLPDRKPPENVEFVGRSQWFSIGMDHVNYILQFLKKHPSMVHYFQFTWGSDEFVFQTILYNSPFKHTMVNNNLRYIVWPQGEASPKTFTIQDADNLLHSNKLFARKFNTQTDNKILDFLDNNRIH